MAQAVAVVNATLTATGSGTTDFTSSGFGTPTAAIIVMSLANTGSNPQAGAALSIGFWDGTNQCSHSINSFDAQGTSVTYRTSRNDYAAVNVVSSTGWSLGFQASSITDGIRLTMAVDNTSAQRYATVILLKGVSAKIARLTLNSTVNSTATTGSLGFAPTAAIVLGSGTAGNTANSGSSQRASALLSFGAATDDGTHRMLAWTSESNTATATLTALYSETRAAAQVFGGAENWSAEVTAWGSDDLTMTSRTAGSGGDDVDILCLGGADLSLLLGTLTTATSTGSVDVATTGIDPDAVLLCLGNTSSTTIASDGTASGISVGISDGTTHGSYAIVDEDAADTTNAESAYSSSNAVQSRTSASGTASDLVVGAVSMGSELFAVNYTTVSGTARKGWWLAFGPAAGGGAYSLTAESGSYALTGQSAGLLASRALAAEQGSYALTGQDVALNRGYVVAAEQGSYALTGQDAGLLRGLLLTAAQGSYALSGQDVTLTYTPLGAYSLTADQGSYDLTGQSVSLLWGRALVAEQGSYALNGQDASLVYTPAGAYSLAAGQGAYALTGQDVALLWSKVLAAAQGSYTITGQDATLSRGIVLTAAQGSYTLTGQDAAFARAYALSAGYGSYALTGQIVSLTYSGAALEALEYLLLISHITQSMSKTSKVTMEVDLISHIKQQLDGSSSI